ncbi:sulfatase family protein [Poriferisphaera sp. WC338]|uniref:sulfatase family protein n=1 Tax=Poriferisphaera sp. WC338 TaxID=3425129 RepID=UPI003D8192A1
MRILHIDIDSLRPDHLGCYGYHRQTSPNIDRIASQGVRFENCHTTDAPCLPSRTALMAGRAGIHTGVIDHGGIAAQPFNEGPNRDFSDMFANTSWMSCMRQAGFHTVAISPFAERHGAWHWYAGFNEIHNGGMGVGETAEKWTPIALDWLENNGHKDNWCLYFNLWDPHTPYRTPDDDQNPFANDPLPEWYTEEIRQAHWQGIGPHSAREVNGYDIDKAWEERFPKQPGQIRDMQEARMMFDGYDHAVHYADKHIGKIMQLLKKLGIQDETIISISADHGENLGELNVYGDHQLADQITTRIPMIIRWPGVTDNQQGQVRRGYIHHFDYAATLIDAFSPGNIPDIWHGQSFYSNLKSSQDINIRDNLIVSQGAWSCQRAVRFNHNEEEYIMLRSYHDGYHNLPDYMLFNLTQDPHEQHDLADKQPQLVNLATNLLDKWVGSMMHTSPSGQDPMWTVMHTGGAHHTRGELTNYLDRLRQTDRQHIAKTLENKYPYDP